MRKSVFQTFHSNSATLASEIMTFTMVVDEYKNQYSTDRLMKQNYLFYLLDVSYMEMLRH